MSEPREPIHRDLIVIGTSAGGVEAMVRVVSALPRDLPASVCVVLHLSPDSTSVLARILTRAGHLPAVTATDGAHLRYSTIYVAPPDRHLLVHEGHLRLMHGPRENRHRPAIDPLFRSAARSYGQRVIGVILTGSGDDGSAGLMLVKHAGGVAVVQDPETALCARMPQSALDHVNVDHCVALEEIGPLLDTLVRQPLTLNGSARKAGLMSARADQIHSMAAEQDVAAVEQSPNSTALSGFTCPECGGRLWELSDNGPLRYRCRVGHAYTAESLLSCQGEALEAALWAGVNALEERAALFRRLSARAQDSGHGRVAERMDVQAKDTDRQADVVRGMLLTASEVEDAESENAEEPSGTQTTAGHPAL